MMVNSFSAGDATARPLTVPSMSNSPSSSPDIALCGGVVSGVHSVALGCVGLTAGRFRATSCQVMGVVGWIFSVFSGDFCLHQQVKCPIRTGAQYQPEAHHRQKEHFRATCRSCRSKRHLRHLKVRRLPSRPTNRLRLAPKQPGRSILGHIARPRHRPS